MRMPKEQNDPAAEAEAGNSRDVALVRGGIESVGSARFRGERRTQMRRSARLLAVVPATMLLTLIAWAGPGQAATTVVGPGDSIQAAVDAAQPGDTIVVQGLHHENVAITTDGITLHGQGAVLEPAATPTENACFNPSEPEDVNGICVLGEVNFDT